MFIFLVLFITFTSCLIFYYKSSFLIANQFKGPLALPIIGNAYIFLNCKNEDILNKISSVVKRYTDSAFRFWMGPFLLIAFNNCDYAERILLSKKFSYKSRIYNVFKIFVGEGLITASGPTYDKHKRVIQPFLNTKIVEEIIPIIEKHFNTHMNKLDELVGKGTFDIHHFVHPIISDTIAECLLGYVVEPEYSEKYHNFVIAVDEMYGLLVTRVTKPWLYPSFIFNRTSVKKKTDEYCDYIEKFTTYIIKKSKERIKCQSNETSKFQPTIDYISAYIVQNPNSFSHQEFVDHLVTLYAASEDTAADIISFLLLFLGMYPEYQEKAANEVRKVFGDTPREVTKEDIKNLPYLEMCIKETMRLIPIGPYIVRQCTEDCTIGDYEISRDCEILIPIFDIHRNPKHWERPNEFYPDHFLPDAVAKRHKFAYMPFSVGPRSCAGQIFAKITLKAMAANFLQRYKFKADGKMSDIKLKMDISVRSANGFKLRIERRIWN